MRFFGPRPWGIGLDVPDMMAPTPEGAVCGHCEEPIAAGDSGVTIPFVGVEGDGCRATFVRGKDGGPDLALHRECHIRSLVGSVGHQRSKCGCAGGSEGDPPGFSKREAARAATFYFEGRTRALLGR